MATDTLNGLNIVFPIYNEDGTPFHNLVLRKSVVDSIVMSLGDKITGDVFYKNNTLQVTMKEYVEYNGIHFSLVNPPTIVREGMVADNGELKGMTKYSFEFYHPMYQLSNFPFTDVATKTGEEKYLSQNKIFSWIGKPQDYIDKLNKNLQGTVWYVRKSDRFPVEKDDELSDVQQFDNISVAEAIKRGYEIWGTPYIVSQLTSNDPLYAQGKRFVVEYGLPSNEIYESEGARQLDTPYVFQMGQGVGLKNNSRTPRNNKIVTRIAGYGSEDNVPYGYPQIVWTGNQDWDYTINNDPNNPLSYPIYKGIVGGQYVKLIKHPFTRTHLMPSIFTETVNKKVNPNAVGYDPTIEIKDYYDAVATQEYPYVNEINLQAPSYESHEFAEIKPELDADRNTGIVSAVPLNADLTPADHWDDSMDDDGNYLQSYFQITLPQLSFDLYACAAITQEMQINMRSGACIGCTFPIQVDWDDYKRNFYDEDGNFVPDGEQRDLTKYPKSNLGQISVIVQKDNSTFGTLMPNIYQQPKANDLFVFIGISLPTSYITNAEVRLDAAMKSYMLENNVYYFDYPLKFDEYFLATHTYILEQIRPNSIIRFDYGGVEQQLFVKQLTVKYGNAPLPQYDITFTDNVDVVLNQIGQVADDVEKLSSLIAILRQSYNRNVWNELAKKLSKVSDDAAQGVITFMRGLISQAYTQFGQGADFGQFVQGLVGGDGARIDEHGNMEATSLVLRSFLEVPKLVYNHVDVRVGDEWQTNGAGEIESVEIDQNNPLQGTIKLRLLDGEYGTIKPQDKCKGIFHHLEGYNDTETKDDGKGGRTFAGFYTSYFVALSVSGDNNEYIRYELRPTIEVNGNTYWQNDEGTSSGIRGGFHPSAHMVFAQYSNAVDNTRQSCQYRTTTYTRMLSNMTGWDEGLVNVAFQIGNTPLIASAYNIPDAGRYSLWINGDIYFAGTLNRVDSWGRDVADYPDQGNYFSTIQYHLNDLVHYDGSVWRMAIENEATIGTAPGTSVDIEGQTVYPWVKWIYADSMNPSGKWNHTLVPYAANSIVNIEGKLLISKRSTSQPPIDLLTDENSEPLQTETGEYIVYSDEVNDDWELLFNVGDLTNGQDGQNAIMVNLTNDTDTVLTDEQGNVIGDLPATTAQLYDGVTLITSGVSWTCQTVGCTATINSQGVVSITAMSADEAKVACIATYNDKTYTKVFTFKKLYGKDSLWLEPSVDKIERYISDITNNVRTYAYAPSTITFNAYIQKSGGEPRALTPSDGYILLGTDATHYASGQVINVADIASLFFGNHLAVRLKDARDNTQDVEDIVLTEENDAIIEAAGAWTYEGQVKKNELLTLFGNVYRAKQDSTGVSPVELLTNENNVPLQDENGEYIAYNYITNTTYYELWIKGSYVIRTEVMYAKGTDGTTTPTSGWSFTKPAVTYGDWLWIRTEVIRSDENNSKSYSVSYVGENAVQLALAVSPDGITLNANGNLKTGSTLTIKIQKTDGSVTTNIQKSSTATFKLWVGSNGYDISDYNSSTQSYSISLAGKNIQSDSYVHVTYVDGDINLDKSVSVTQDGSQGLQGCVTRVSEWKAGVTYKHDAGLALGYIDVVGVRNSSAADGTGWDFYECKAEHKASTSNQPQKNTKYWTKLNNLGATYTSLLIADNAFIRFGATNQFVVLDSNNKIEAGMKGSGDIRFWAGGGVTYDANNQPTDINLNNANFRVKKDGSLYAKNAYIEGEIHATSGEFTGEIIATSGKITGNLAVTGDGIITIGDTGDKFIQISPSNGSAFTMNQKQNGVIREFLRMDFGYEGGFGYFPKIRVSKTPNLWYSELSGQYLQLKNKTAYATIGALEGFLTQDTKIGRFHVFIDHSYNVVKMGATNAAGQGSIWPGPYNSDSDAANAGVLIGEVYLGYFRGDYALTVRRT